MLPGLLPRRLGFGVDDRSAAEVVAPSRYEEFRLLETVPFGVGMWWHKPTISIVAAASAEEASRWASEHYRVICTEEWHRHGVELAKKHYEMKRGWWSTFI